MPHLAAKLAILQGCADAGYEAEPEWSEGCWRADVLAVQGNRRIAFEVQWSRQTLHDLLARQERYGHEGVRGCWFVRFPPRGLPRTDDERDIEARRDLPLFLLQPDPDMGPAVLLNGRGYPLDRFVAALLTGQIHFRRQVEIPAGQPVSLRFFEVTCWSCGNVSHACCLERPAYLSDCGLALALHRRWYATARAALRPEVQRAMWAFLLTDEGLRLRVGTVKPRPTPTRPDPPLSFGCFYCDATLDDYLLLRHEERARSTQGWSAVYDTTVCLPKDLILQRPHWCFPVVGTFCSV
jgi:hypothetical protein